MATPRELLLALSRAYEFTDSRFSGDPEYVGALEEVCSAHAAMGWSRIQVRPAVLTVNGETVQVERDELGPLRDALEEAGIEELRLHDPAGPEVVEEFLRRVHPSSAGEGLLPSARFRGLGGGLGFSFRQASADLPGMVGSVQALFQSGDVAWGADTSAPEADAIRGPEEDEAEPSVLVPPSLSVPAGAEDTHAQALGYPLLLDAETFEDLGPRRPPVPLGSRPPEGHFAPPRPSLPPELDALVGDFLEETGTRRVELGQGIRDAAEEMKERRDVAGQAELVQRLAESVGAATGDEEVLGLTMDLTTPAVASQVVGLLGSTRDEYERGQLGRVVSRMGREGALALADALGEARDRRQRRAFRDAMVGMGPLGLEMAEGMADDPRWFVVRNSVVVLGELGGEGAVTTLTGTLGNQDARVRREAVTALAKLGGDDAGILILGMLDDGEAEVRAAACRGLGALRVSRAVRVLVGLLETESDNDVQVECLRALGQIGDPGAVPPMEKKAVGGIFSRPSREIRVAAYRALAAIGTPHAKSLLEKAAKDGDPGVQAAVKALLGGS